MLCSAGHPILEEAKREFLFGWHVCSGCQRRVSERGGHYHKCSGDCKHYCVCDRCYQAARQRHYDLEPCLSPFPGGLGPFSVHRTGLRPGDLRALDPLRHRPADPRAGGSWVLRDSFFRKSDALLHVWAQLLEHGLTAELPAAGAATARGQRCLALQVSPGAAVSLPAAVRRAADIPAGGEVNVAWVYPLSIDWQALLTDTDDDLLSGADMSLLTVGGFVYFKEPAAEHSEVEVLCANSIAFSARGALRFSAPQPWKAEWTAALVKAKRFHRVTVHKWAAEGAKYMCWICPEERLLRPRAQHGGFAFLFQEPGDSSGDQAGVAAGHPAAPRMPLFFEIVAALGDSRETLPAMALPPRLLDSAFAFRLADSPTQESPTKIGKVKKRFKVLLRDGRWRLMLHLLSEWPELAEVTDENGQSALHRCAVASRDCRDSRDLPLREILTVLHQAGAGIDAKDGQGRTAFELGDKTFRTIASMVWDQIPDLFSDPEVWFAFWDKDHSGNLGPAELAPALAAAYEVGELGRRWIETYVNTHYRELAPGCLLTKEEVLRDQGLLHKLQSSEEFISLRQREARTGMPAVWRAEGHKEPTARDRAALAPMEAKLAALRGQAGWEPGRAAAAARPLQVPAAFAGGAGDPGARLAAAREMLAWSFMKTVAKSRKDWLQGFKVSFTGGHDAGIDEGGLTKAWVNELAFALWGGDEALFDLRSNGFFFKPDDVAEVTLHVFNVKTESLYRWVGRFVAYALYQGCVFDCNLCPWVLRWLVRVAEAWAQVPRELRSLAGDWQGQESGERVATIRGSTLISHIDEEQQPVERALRVHNGVVTTEVDGRPITASMEVGRLRWSNGDVWVKCRESLAPCVAAQLPETPDGDDRLLDDLASLDPQFANSLWRVLYEMPEEDLQWLTFSYNGTELEPGGEDREVTAEGRARYVRLCCRAALLGRAHNGLQWFAEGFFDVLPHEVLLGAPADGVRWLIAGGDGLSSEQLDALERTVIPDGLVPRHLCDNPLVRQTASWVFKIARSMDGPFRARLLEFWTGSSRLPLGGPGAISPRPRLQVMVQARPLPPVWEVEVQGGWRRLDDGLVAIIVSAAEAGRRQVQFRMGQGTYAIDLQGMLQTNLQTGARRKIRSRRQDVDVADPSSVIRIEAWPAARLPEGHTCGNELWVPLCDSEAELSERLRLSVGNFEAGFALS